MVIDQMTTINGEPVKFHIQLVCWTSQFYEKRKMLYQPEPQILPEYFNK